MSMSRVPCRLIDARGGDVLRIDCRHRVTEHRYRIHSATVRTRHFPKPNAYSRFDLKKNGLASLSAACGRIRGLAVVSGSVGRDGRPRGLQSQTHVPGTVATKVTVRASCRPPMRLRQLHLTQLSQARAPVLRQSEDPNQVRGAPPTSRHPTPMCVRADRQRLLSGRKGFRLTAATLFAQCSRRKRQDVDRDCSVI